MVQLPNREPEKHINITVFGDVQGVFFRRSAKLKAEALGIHGFVRNEPDGTVNIEAEGPGSDLNEFLAWCRTGFDPAAVVSVESAISENLKNYYGFEIQ